MACKLKFENTDSCRNEITSMKTGCTGLWDHMIKSHFSAFPLWQAVPWATLAHSVLLVAWPDRILGTMMLTALYSPSTGVPNFPINSHALKGYVLWAYIKATKYSLKKSDYLIFIELACTKHSFLHCLFWSNNRFIGRWENRTKNPMHPFLLSFPHDDIKF